MYCCVYVPSFTQWWQRVDFLYFTRRHSSFTGQCMYRTAFPISKPDTDTYQMTAPTWYVNNSDTALARIMINISDFTEYFLSLIFYVSLCNSTGTFQDRVALGRFSPDWSSIRAFQWDQDTLIGLRCPHHRTKVSAHRTEVPWGQFSPSSE